MKKIAIFLLCYIIFSQSSIGLYAAEISSVLVQNQEEKIVENIDQISEEIKTENEQPQNESNEEVKLEEKEQIEGEEKLEEKEQAKGEEKSEERKQLQKEEISTEIEETQEDSLKKIEQNLEKIENETEDPQYGREHGYVDESFLEIVSFYNGDLGYVHDEKFSDYLIKDVIDVSRYQGDIDWETVKKSGINYAFIRAGFRGYGENGSLNVDSKFAENMQGAIGAGIEVGVYFFSQAITEDEAVDEAEYVLNLIDDYDVALPVVIDFEYASSSEGLIGRLYNANLSKQEATDICKQFCASVENAGYTPMVYANKEMLESDLNTSQIAEDYKIWLANYTTSTSYQGTYDFWQYTQNGTVEGITGSVDKSFWYKKPTTVYNGVDYSPIYDFYYYLDNNIEIDEMYVDDDSAVLKHFVEYGMKEGRIANKEFNVFAYKNRYADLREGFGNNWSLYYIHYLNAGMQEGRTGRPDSNYVTVYKGVDYSPVYDFEYYMKNNDDLRIGFGNDENAALKHFVENGMAEGRIGNQEFNVYTYKNRYADLRGGFGDNWRLYYTHYLNAGIQEGRTGKPDSNYVTVYKGVDYSPVYDFEYYMKNNDDLRIGFGNDENAALKHFVENGMAEGRIGNQEFNVYTYRNRYADLRGGFGKDWKRYYIHYLSAGQYENRSGVGLSELIAPVTVYNGVDYSSVYDFKYYIEHNEDIKNIFGDDDNAALKHFVENGIVEGRIGNDCFNVYVYRERYADLRAGYGKNWRMFYMHYINYGALEGRSGIEIGKIKGCEIGNSSKEEMTINLELELTSVVQKFDEYYIVQTDLYDESLDNSWKMEKGTTGLQSTKIVIKGEDAVQAALMDEISLAVKNNDGNLMLASDSINISNPEALAQNTTPIFKGTSKKGLQGVYYASDSDKAQPADARYTNTKQTLINLDLSTVVSKTPKSGYISYSYKGNTYNFSDLEDLKTNIKSLNFGYKQYLYGNSGRTPVAVSLCLLLKYNEENSFLIDPAARTYIKDKYYTLNVREEYARETLEALFFYLGETFGQNDCYVSNWILGNEINSSKAWNYSGSLDFDTYMECYATAYRMLYTAVKSEKTGNTVSISLDNGWTAAPDTYAGKVTLDTFAKKIHAQNPNIDWSIAYHPYSYPLTRGDFWNDYSNTTDNISTPYISMKNINVLTNYAGTLESTYGKKSGSIRILLTEQGYSYAAGKEVQAQAIARGYYIAEFNDRIDAFIIRAIVDDEDEAKGKLYFGLMNSQQDKRISYYVYEHMDSDLSRLAQQSAEGYVTWENYTNFNNAKSILCNTNWNAIVPGFNALKLTSIK